MAFCGGFKYSPITLVILAKNFGSRDNLKVRCRCGFTLCICQSRFTVSLLTPWALAMVRQLQWVMPKGLVCKVASMSASRWAWSMRCLRPRPAAISHTDGMPSFWVLCRQSDAVWRLIFKVEAIWRSGWPLAAARTMRQWRATCWGVLCEASHCSNCSRSSELKIIGSLFLGTKQLYSITKRMSSYLRDTTLWSERWLDLTPARVLLRPIGGRLYARRGDLCQTQARG